MRLSISTRLAAAPEAVWSAVRTPRLLRHIAFPLIVFHSREPDGFSETWTPGRHRVFMFAFGFLPLGPQTIGIEYPVAPQGEFRLRDNGSGLLARTWDHLITIRPDGAGGTHYTDSVEIYAGVLTVFIWGYSHLFYRWRQHRWRGLVRRGKIT